MKEYNLIDTPVEQRYCHPIMDWYIRHHFALIDGTLDKFKMEKPPINMKDDIQRKKTKLVTGLKNFG